MGASKRRKDLALEKGEPWPPTEPERRPTPRQVLECARCGFRRPHAALPILACACGSREWRQAFVRD